MHAQSGPELSSGKLCVGGGNSDHPAPGAYTAIVNGVAGGTGIGLVEVFEADATTVSEISNISTRGFVQSGDDEMIGGLIIEGSSPATVLIRARGPSMSGAPFLVPGTLANPFLRLFSGQDMIAQNDNWQDGPSCNGFVCGTAAQIAATGLDPCQPIRDKQHLLRVALLNRRF